MKILEKNKIGNRWASFAIRCGLTAVTVFGAVTMAGAEPTEVSSFGELQGAISTGKTEIAIKNTINFTADGPVINYSNIVISGPSENAPGLLNGGNNRKLLIFGESAKNILLKNLHFNGGHDSRPKFIFGETNPEAGGGAINLRKGTEAILENITFSNSQTATDGGAIYSRGINSSNRNSLNFTGKTTFDGNKTIGTIGSGGAIYAENSSLTFGGLATFRGNNSTFGGGAICGYHGTKLTFGGDVTFTGNSSFLNGGAICSLGVNATNKNILEFEGNATFVGNSVTEVSNGDGGAIFVRDSSLTFGGLATFENNKTRFCGAIFASGSASIEFNNGLILIENTTNGTNSGALHMNGSENEPAIITLIQKNPLVPTEFRGNTSGGDGGHNAVYMAEYSQLNLTAHDGSIDIFDDFSGNREGPDNIITIYKGEGWLNIEKSGSIENVKVVNGGNLNLAGESRGFNLIDFTNSGTIRFEILSGE
ncbi:MAG: hypothetical protein LBB13_02195, partial [Rickettsiales bacterium]|nr:hypothetical protein [Rickettsiales bacterium]